MVGRNETTGGKARATTHVAATAGADVDVQIAREGAGRIGFNGQAVGLGQCCIHNFGGDRGVRVVTNKCRANRCRIGGRHVWNTVDQIQDLIGLPIIQIREVRRAAVERRHGRSIRPHEGIGRALVTVACVIWLNVNRITAIQRCRAESGIAGLMIRELILNFTRKHRHATVIGDLAFAGQSNIGIKIRIVFGFDVDRTLNTRAGDGVQFRQNIRFAQCLTQNERRG